MSDQQHDHQHHGHTNGGTSHPGHRPYWKRAHRGWPFWVAVFLMLAAMFIYLWSDDLRGWNRGKLRQPISGAVGN
jgi:hypothetical protein